MVINKRKKNSRQRASTNHGWGKGKAHHKGAGSRGGRGNAGSGKRGDAKKPSFWKSKYFGKVGFKSKRQHADIKVININYLQEHLESLVEKKLAQKEGEVYSIDLGKMGFNKLLATGNVSSKFKIQVDYASKSSIEKIQKAGGEVAVKEK